MKINQRGSVKFGFAPDNTMKINVSKIPTSCNNKDNKWNEYKMHNKDNKWNEYNKYNKYNKYNNHNKYKYSINEHILVYSNSKKQWMEGIVSQKYDNAKLKVIYGNREKTISASSDDIKPKTH